VKAERFEQMSMAERYDALSRRRFLATAAKAAAVATTAGPMLLTRRATAATAQTPIGPRWLAMGADPSRQMRVSWQLPAPVTNPQVRFGTGTTYGQVVPAELTSLQTRAPGGMLVEQYYVHATLDGLNPGQSYRYMVEHDGVRGGGGTFRTAPAAGVRERFTFTAFGDQGVTAHSVQNNLAVAAQRPAFHLLAGDISYADTTGHGLATDEFRPHRWDIYFQEVSTVAEKVPWMVTTGNHEMEALYPGNGYGGLTRRFALPGNGPAGCPGAYTFRYGTVGVVSLDANDVSYEVSANRGYTQGVQTTWLKNTLAQLRADPEIEFLVVFFHQCPYATCTAHGSDAGVRAEWPKLFDQHSVDLVINGHNHSYERTDPIRAGAAPKAAPSGSTVWPLTEGTTYVVAGGGGIDLEGFRAGDGAAKKKEDIQSTLWAQPGVTTTEQVTWSRVRYTGYTFLAVHVVPGPGRSTMTVRALRPDGSEVDRFTIARANSHGGSGTGLALAAGAGAVVLAGAGAGAVAVHRRRGRTESLETS
jgi:Purple acid Phosphatase, N-terminal domain/Calcineurin-like phosphoesterase